MGLQTAAFLWRHPLARRHRLRAFGRWVGWQVRSRLLRRPAVVPFAGAARLLVAPGMTGATGNLYAGLHEFEDMAFVLHALRPGDLFVDVGANVGAYTVLAGAAAGADVLAFEPVPGTFRHLLANVELNALGGRVTARNEGVGREAGTLAFSAGEDTTNHVAAEGEAGRTVRVPVTTLDAQGVDGERPVLVKVDVEGWETPVLEGAEGLLRAPGPRALIVEMNGSGARYGFDERALHERLRAWGFTPAAYHPFERRLATADGAPASVGNTLYVRAPGFFAERVRTAPPVAVFGERL